ncbi:MAG: flagellin [Alphaproteobacteria bacterium]|nr:flagellin [Alphaproteobacteria bacterium SS10]
MSQDQREIYSSDLAEQFRQLRNFLDGAEYNERNLIAGNRGTAVGELNGNFANYSTAADAKVIRSIDGSSITLRANDLIIGTGAAVAAGTSGGAIDGFQAFARIVYASDTTAAGASDGQATADFAAISSITNQTSGLDANNLVERQFIGARIAQAALADLTTASARATDAFFSADSATAGTASVFNSAFAFFEREVALALGSLGADNRSVDFQIDFNTAIQDAVEEGLGSLVDADLARESARLQALQTKQQLSIQTLSIANQNPTILLSLFQ